MIRDYYFYYQTNISSVPSSQLSPMMIEHQQMITVLQKMQQQLIVNQQAYQTLITEIKTLKNSSSTSLLTKSYLLWVIQQIERALTFALFQKIFHKLTIVFHKFN